MRNCKDCCYFYRHSNQYPCHSCKPLYIKFVRMNSDKPDEYYFSHGDDFVVNKDGIKNEKH